MPKPDPILFELQNMINDLSLISRRSFIADTDRRENDIEHSLTVAILSWYIHDKYKIGLDITKILKYALTHDFVERYAGDVSTFASTEERQKKLIREKASLERLSREFKTFPDMISMMSTYEAKIDEEALFVWTVDKMQQLIMGDINAWRSHAEAEISYDEFLDKYNELASNSSKYCREVFEGLIEYSKTTYYDQPKEL